MPDTQAPTLEELKAQARAAQAALDAAEAALPPVDEKKAQQDDYKNRLASQDAMKYSI